MFVVQMYPSQAHLIGQFVKSLLESSFNSQLTPEFRPWTGLYGNSFDLA